MTTIQQSLLMHDVVGVDPAWTNVFGTSNNDWSYSNTVDSIGNVYLVGLARTGSWGTAWGCLHKFDKDGNFQWGRTIGDASASHNTWFTSVAVSSDRIAVVGQTLNNPNAPNTGNYQDMIVAMYDMSGTLQWQKIYGKVTEWPGQNWSHHDMSEHILIDSSNNVYICGNQQNQCGSGIGVCNANALIIKFDSSGTLQWQKKWNVAGEQGNLNTEGGSERGRTEQFRDMAFDSNGDIIVAGVQEDTWDQADEDYLVMKYNPSSGSVLMEKKVSWGANEYLTGMTLDSNDNIYCVGGNGTGATNSNKPTISKFNSSMVHQWTKEITSLGHKSFTSVRCDSFDNVYAMFYHEDLLTGSSNDDLGIIKFDSSGNVVWQRALGCHAGSDIAFSHNPMTIKGNSLWFSTHGTTGGLGSSDRSITRIPIDGSLTGTYTVASQTWEYDSMNVTIANGSAPTVSSSGLSAYGHDAQVWNSTYANGSLIHTYTHHLTPIVGGGSLSIPNINITTDIASTYSATAGSGQNFTVAASDNANDPGTTTITYQWKYSTNSGSTWTDIVAGEGGTSATLTRYATSYYDDNDHQIKCAISGTNADGSNTKDSTVCTLSISRSWTESSEQTGTKNNFSPNGLHPSAPNQDEQWDSHTPGYAGHVTWVEGSTNSFSAGAREGACDSGGFNGFTMKLELRIQGSNGRVHWNTQQKSGTSGSGENYQFGWTGGNWNYDTDGTPQFALWVIDNGTHCANGEENIFAKSWTDCHLSYKYKYRIYQNDTRP